MSDFPALKKLIVSNGVRARNLILGLDFDGTLVPIAKRPEQAFLPVKTKFLLKTLIQAGVKIAILSGRSLTDVRTKIGVSGIYYCGNHGLEISGPGLRWSHPSARAFKRKLAALECAARKNLTRIHGLRVENKGMSLSVHYRQAEASAALVRRALLGIREMDEDVFRLMPGKKVWEILPKVRWSKGDALLIARRDSGRRNMIVIGDDETDEEGFRVLRARAVSLRVGQVRRTAARFHLRDSRQVVRVLDFLARRAS
ncbi:MAG: trehalose-phosphatase [Elusimicrobiota bacterium]